MVEPRRDVVYFGRTDYRNTKRLFGIKRKDRRQHMYVMGKTGTGKTALLHNAVVQDITNGDGVCVVDPHGEFVESLLAKIPEERLKDVIYFNPADMNHPIGFNPLDLPDPRYRHLAASGLMAIFTKIWANVWSARMEYILNNAILALLETPNSTLLGVNRILVDKDFRQKILFNVTDPVVKAFWTNEFEAWRDQFRNEAIAPIQNKVGQFLSTDLIRNVVGQARSTIDIFDIMNTRKIFLVNVSKGRIGEDNSALLGAMLITKIQLAAMERVRIPEEDRTDFYLYVDEFQNFATDSFAGILSEARKYRLNLIIAHQYIGQLVTDVSTKVRDAVFGNCGTMIIFRVGALDAEFLEQEFSPEFLPEDIVNLPNYSVYLKLMVDGVTSRPFSAATLPPFKVPTSAVTMEKVIETSRRMYTMPKAEVEKAIADWSGMMGDFPTKETSEQKPGNALPEGQKISARCSSCGKSTEINFVPTEGRAIYCRECLAKVKAGEIPKVKVVKVKAPETGDKYFSDLAGMGIEFEVPKGEIKKAKGEELRRPGLARPSRKGVEEAASKHEDGGEPRLSLNELKTDDKIPRAKKPSDVNIDELRKSIAMALVNQTDDEAEAKSEQNENKEGEEKHSV
ncbi:MAG: type IV secretion system DNA-binding domain-containing protein [Patescibacteria group bacterium]